MSTPYKVLCVGGPFSGRLYEVTREMRMLKIPQWPSPSRVIRDQTDPGTYIKNLVIDVQLYRWHEAKYSVSFGSLTCIAMVHDSMSNADANRACAAAFFTQLLYSADSNAAQAAEGRTHT